MADTEAVLTRYAIERRIEVPEAMFADQQVPGIPAGAELWLKVGEREAQGARTALRQWGQAAADGKIEGVTFVSAMHRAIPLSNITEEEMAGETVTKITFGRKA